MVHLAKLAVGLRDLDHLRLLQSTRTPLVHTTRHAPARRAEALAGGSIYWVVAGFMRARQRLLAIEPARDDAQRPCADLHLDPALVPVVPRATRAFQGWRYLDPSAAPPDLDGAQVWPSILPPGLERDLRALGLL